MNYHIEWEADVLKRFTDTYDRLDKRRQHQVMDTLDDTDRLLREKPLEVGESRASESQRVLIHLPVLLVYRVNHRLQIVTIVDAHIF